MSALSAARNTPQRIGETFGFPMKASVKGYQGGIAVLNAGYLAPATTATGLIAVGRFKDTYDNTSGANAAISGEAERGVFKFANSASTDLITQADVGADCYIVDDQTVAKTNGTNTRSRAGKIVAVDSDGVWVQIGLGL